MLFNVQSICTTELHGSNRLSPSADSQITPLPAECGDRCCMRVGEASVPRTFMSPERVRGEQDSGIPRTSVSLPMLIHLPLPPPSLSVLVEMFWIGLTLGSQMILRRRGRREREKGRKGGERMGKAGYTAGMSAAAGRISNLGHWAQGTEGRGW